VEEVIWVEILSRHRDVAARHRCMGPVIQVGRGYDNDVVIDDPHVAPRHLCIRRDEAGHLVALDQHSTNGLFADRDKTRVERIVLDGDHPIRIGHTLLRVRDATHTVAPERAMQRQRSAWPIALALTFVIVAIELVGLRLNEVAEPKLSRYLAPILGMLVVVIAWTAIWAVLARVFSGQARFERNLVVALGGLLTYSLYNELVDVSVFAFTWRQLVAHQYVGIWLLLAATCFLHLRELGPSHIKLKAAAVSLLAAAAVGLHMLGQFDVLGGIDREAPTRRLLPPAFRLAPVRTTEVFFADVGELRAKLNRDRADRGSNWLDLSKEDDD